MIVKNQTPRFRGSSFRVNSDVPGVPWVLLFQPSGERAVRADKKSLPIKPPKRRTNHLIFLSLLQLSKPLHVPPRRPPRPHGHVNPRSPGVAKCHTSRPRIPSLTLPRRLRASRSAHWAEGPKAASPGHTHARPWWRGHAPSFPGTDPALADPIRPRPRFRARSTTGRTTRLASWLRWSEDIMGPWPTTMHEGSLDSRPRFHEGTLTRE